MIAEIAVSCAVFAIDKPYSYRVPDLMTLECGMRVRIPFGKGNRHTEGIVLHMKEGSADTLKFIEAVLDEQPVLDERQMRLAAWMCERYFCTYYDAVKAILPAGLWFKTTQRYTICRQAEDWRGECAKNDAAMAVMQALEDLGGSAEEKTLQDIFSDETLASALRWLLSRKLIAVSAQMKPRTKEKTRKMAELAISAEEAMELADRKRRAAPLQAAVLELLCSVGIGSCSELCALTGASMATLNRLNKLGIVDIREERVRTIPERPVFAQAEPIVLNDQQQAAYDGLLEQMHQPKPKPALLYGVTGSGKTSVYIRLIASALEEGRSAILLVPEIALTPQLLARLSAYFGSQVAVLHSSLRVSERYEQWKRIQRGEVTVVVGTRSAVFAPVKDPALFILDEEQEHTYKSENSPRYHARQIAMYRAYQTGALVLMGSATPCVESMYHAKSGNYQLYSLTRRYNGMALPDVQIVDMKQELRSGNNTSVSLVLERALRGNIEEGKQSILFLNRRGNSRCMVCVECGEVPSCPRCSVHLTYHSVNERLMCHYCGYGEPAIQRCKSCGGAMKTIGSGTQKIEQELTALFPDTRVLRMDADTVSSSGGHEAILDEFSRRKVPLLLGTQMVAKGLDFPLVTLAGVLDADLSLYVANYRAAETTFSLITQLVGRAGRGESGGTAIIQTMTPENPVLKLAARQDYDAFYDMEIGMRQLRRCPPFRDLFTVTFSGLDEQQVLRAAALFREALKQNLQRPPYAQKDAAVLGPAPASVVRINYSYRYRLTLACQNTKTIRQLLAFLLRAFSRDKQTRGVTAFADVDTYD